MFQNQVFSPLFASVLLTCYISIDGISYHEKLTLNIYRTKREMLNKIIGSGSVSKHQIYIYI